MVMDGSRVTQCLDSLWFYTNILTCRHDPVANSLTDQFFAPSIHANEPHKTDLQKPNTPLFLLNQQHDESQKVEILTPRCHKKIGEISSAFEEERVKPDNSEMVKSTTRETDEKRDRRKGGKWNRARQQQINGKKVIGGGLDLGFDVKDVKDDVEMKKHLRSWAYAVACTIKLKQFGRWN